MHTSTKKRTKHNNHHLSRQLPRTVTRQLESIYAQSFKKIKRHPYRTSSVILGLGVASGLYLLIRYLQNNR